MSRHLKQWINDAELRRRGGRYVGVVVAVVEEVVRNLRQQLAGPPHHHMATRALAADAHRA